ncbi:cytochrome c [Sphingobium sp. B2D3A]|uniref:c-type cytochrome n=1 Tax=unclassified Sphingobium TaxID=2611147 RepID=UPI00222487C9|nr:MULTISPECIES: c-type cytochrome [unclassified Sphingobium]MCW2338874.1 cytochrome c [Sphingobium sp. B2D3A]MCW2385299.1 cytochrome c [Sphingobium sp. B2D3D]MCW2387316.1 cytochrome c [Sphingobium sp. B11D3B]MCW2394035.1 cytochrome c [Sphingobium sp. B8D3B]MCW2413359.1 cytochrome c [Sphingobium sp. B8D3D]
MRIATFVLSAVLTLSSAPLLAQSADKGRAAFAQCAVCHGTKPGEKKLAPSLAGVVGRKAGVVPGMTAPSPALAKWGRTWSTKELDTFLTAPAKLVPGTRMAISVPDDGKRADIIAYLKTLK